ncbi:hypothetical protein K501DRAFT_328019 [Backusella circina FSU 941]|nr:hypothetical protein K501DRAFT_328019 [Backusella circina FSU 941]
MAKNRERAIKRKEQSERDQLNYLNQHSIYNQANKIQKWRDSNQPHFMYTPITYDYIDIATAYLTSLLCGKEFMLTSSTSYREEELLYFRENANFIRRILSKAQIPLTSLICSLWYVDQYVARNKPNFLKRSWCVRELFTASIIIAEKYVSDVTYVNSDWAEWTKYQTTYINEIEWQFLQDINFEIYISKSNYDEFFNYLMFSNNQRQLNYISLSYQDVDVLSKWISPIYLKRLNITLRPLDAMILLAKVAASMCFVYAAAVATIVYAGYVISHNMEYFIAFIDRNRMAMMVMSGVDMMAAYERRGYTMHSITSSYY